MFAAASPAHKPARFLTMENLHQATAVAINGRALLIQGPPGCGKTSLALILIDRGANLIGDDGVALSDSHGTLMAAPPTATDGLIEIRNVGIIKRNAARAPVALILDIVSEAPRYIEDTLTADLMGHEIPCLQFSLLGPADAIRAEYALRSHGRITDID